MNKFNFLFGLKQNAPESRLDHEAKQNGSSLFGSDSDSEDSQSQKKPVKRIITSASDARQQPSTTPAPARFDISSEDKLVGAEPSQNLHNSQKVSQIARLVERRRIAKREVGTNLEGEEKDEVLFRYDVEKCPEHAGVTQYEQTPVDGFGEALLRAMGWKGKVVDGGREGPKPRPARLALGAKLGGPSSASTNPARKRERSPETALEREEINETLKGLGSEDESSGLRRFSRQRVASGQYQPLSAEHCTDGSRFETVTFDSKREQGGGSREEKKEKLLSPVEERNGDRSGRSEKRWISPEKECLRPSERRTKNQWLAFDGRKSQGWKRLDEGPSNRATESTEEGKSHTYRTGGNGQWGSYDIRGGEKQLASKSERRCNLARREEETLRGYGIERKQRRSRFYDNRAETIAPDFYNTRDWHGSDRDEARKRSS